MQPTRAVSRMGVAMGVVLRDEEREFGDAPTRFRLTVSLTDELPPEDHVSAAHCLAFAGDRLVLARHVEREWTIPGGHVEPGETVEEAMRREALEEAGVVVGAPTLLAVERIERLSGPAVSDRYPEPAFQVFFVAPVVADLVPPSALEECTESRFFSPDEARGAPGWVQDLPELYEAALAWAVDHLCAVDPQSFDDFADAFDRYSSLVDEPAWPWLSSPDVGVTGGGRALDAGCGSGRRTVELAQHFDEVVGIDLSGPLVALARSRRPAAGVRYEVADLSTFADPDGFDLVYSAMTLHHVDPLEDGLANLRSLVRPGGAAVLVDVVLGAPPWVRWLWRHGAVYLSPLEDVPARIRRLGLGGAWRAFRFETDRRWVHHLLSDRYLSRADFDRRYRSVFPDGRVLDTGAAALVWHRPPA